MPEQSLTAECSQRVPGTPIVFLTFHRNVEMAFLKAPDFKGDKPMLQTMQKKGFAWKVACDVYIEYRMFSLDLPPFLLLDTSFLSMTSTCMGNPAQPEQLAPVRSFWQLPCKAASLEARSIRQSNAGAHFHRNPSGPKTIQVSLRRWKIQIRTPS